MAGEQGIPHTIPEQGTMDQGLGGEKKVKFESNINDLLPIQSGRVAELSLRCFI